MRTAAEYCADLATARACLQAAVSDLFQITEELREIAHGIHPGVPSEAGLGPALRILLRRSAIPTEVCVCFTDRLPAPIEVCAYYIVSEMPTDAAKHAQATAIRIHASVDGGPLHVSVRDDGFGGVNPAGSGITGLRDRLGLSAERSPLTATTAKELSTSAGCRPWSHHNHFGDAQSRLIDQ